MEAWLFVLEGGKVGIEEIQRWWLKVVSLFDMFSLKERKPRVVCIEVWDS